MYFTEREQSINKLEESMQRQITDLDTQISIMEATLQFQIDNGLLWAQVNEILKQTPEAIISYITENNTEFKGASDTDRHEQLEKIGDEVTFFKEHEKEIEKALTSPIKGEQDIDLSDIDSSIDDVETAVDGVKGAIDDLDLTPEDPTPQEGSEEEGVRSEGIDEEGLPVVEVDDIVDPTDIPEIDLGTSLITGSLLPTAPEPGSQPQSQQEEQPQTTTTSGGVFVAKGLADVAGDTVEGLILKKIKRYASGGDIDYTGPAWVDGTKNEPEHIFNFDQMNKLREHLLNGVDVTRRAVSSMSNMAQQLSNTNAYNNINNSNDNGINIDRLEFHMEVKELNNDYDARRAGEQAMEEIVRIARRSGTRSLPRR